MRLKIDKEKRDLIRDLIQESFFIDGRETLKMFEDDIGVIYKLIEQTPITNDTQEDLLRVAILDRENHLLKEIIEMAADNIVCHLAEGDSDW
jgi:hypothetical protein